MSDEKEIGVVNHYFGHIHVAGVQLTQGDLKIGDTVRIKGHTSDFTCRVESMQIEHNKVPQAKRGDSIGIVVPEHAREHDKVYKVVG